MGIVVNNGIRLPTVRIERLRFAADTPYETIVEADPPEPVRVLRPEIAAVVRRALVDTVERGPPRRASHSFPAADGTRTDNRRVGKQCVTTCETRWQP